MDKDEELPIVHIACKSTKSIAKGKEGQSSADRYDQHCDSMTAYKLPQRTSGIVSYRCTKCRNTWSVPVGGQFHGI
jgi:hypothetical protein